MTKAPNLAETHEQYPDGFPERLTDDLLGHWPTANGVVVVEHHPHGYEVHFGPCMDFANCEACAPDHGPSNPHTDDGHHFRQCENRGAIVTVAGGEAGHRAVLEYLAREESQAHVEQFEQLLADDAAREAARIELERNEAEEAAAEEESYVPSPEERLAALKTELAALERDIHHRDSSSRP